MMGLVYWERSVMVEERRVMIIDQVQEIQPARGWTAADYCTNCINYALSPEMGGGG